VGIARALGADPPLLLFDEPFASLDPITRFELQQQFLELRRTVRKTALFVTHDVREALLLGSRIALLRDGALECVATQEEFRAAHTREARAFLSCIEGHGIEEPGIEENGIEEHGSKEQRGPN
jgi:ABC-type proline/glycine betaine transport system ATPase subunit